MGLAMGFHSGLGFLGGSNRGRDIRFLRTDSENAQGGRGQAMTKPRALSRPMLRQHIIAAFTILAVSLLGTTAYLADRREPFVVRASTMVPEAARPGERVRVIRRSLWIRQCQGWISREFIGPDGRIRAYAKQHIRIPTTLGEQLTESNVVIPERSPNGETIYRAIVVFPDCGVLARWFNRSIILALPDLRFDVVSYQ